MKENIENIYQDVEDQDVEQSVNCDVEQPSEDSKSDVLELYKEIMEPEYYLYADSRIGGRSENQDSYGAVVTPFGLLAIVCDGMGGARGGATASRIAVTTIAQYVMQTSEKSIFKILTEAIKSANLAIYEKGYQIPELRGMGTTAVVLLITDDNATIAHVGDSRVYQIRGKKKVFRTFDHSMVFELVKRGRITEEQARLSAESNVILRALGTKPDVDVEISENIPYLKGDKFLLCSDGVCGAVDEKSVLKYVNSTVGIKETVESMLTDIDEIGVRSGGKHDNMTATIVEINKNSKLKVKMTKTVKKIIAALVVGLIISLGLNSYLLLTKYRSTNGDVTQEECLKNSSGGENKE